MNHYLIIESYFCTLFNGHIIQHFRTIPNIYLALILKPEAPFPCCLISPSFSFLVPHFLSLNYFKSRCHSSSFSHSFLLVYPLMLTFLPHLSLSVCVCVSFSLPFSLSLHPIHSPSTDPRQSEKDNSLVLCRETVSKNREGYLSCSILKECLRFPQDD